MSIYVYLGFEYQKPVPQIKVPGQRVTALKVVQVAVFNFRPFEAIAAHGHSGSVLPCCPRQNQISPKRPCRMFAFSLLPSLGCTEEPPGELLKNTNIQPPGN